MLVVSITPLPPYPPGEEPPVLICRRLGGPQSRSGRYGEVKILDPKGTRTPTLLSCTVFSWYINKAPFHKNVWGSGGINLCIINLGNRSGHLSPVSESPRKEPLVPVGETPEPVWTMWRRGKHLVPAGNRNRNPPSLYKRVLRRDIRSYSSWIKILKNS
jgi:hypothetical protein